MTLKERLSKNVGMTGWQLRSTIVVTLLGTLCLISVWPQFHDDAMSFPWWAYLILIALSSIPLFQKK